MATDELELGVSTPAGSLLSPPRPLPGSSPDESLLTVGLVSWMWDLAGGEQADGRGLPGRGEGSRDTTDSDRMRS